MLKSLRELEECAKQGDGLAIAVTGEYIQKGVQIYNQNKQALFDKLECYIVDALREKKTYLNINTYMVELFIEDYTSDDDEMISIYSSKTVFGMLISDINKNYAVIQKSNKDARILLNDKCILGLERIRYYLFPDRCPSFRKIVLEKSRTER